MKQPGLKFAVCGETRILRWIALVCCLASAAATIGIAYVVAHFILKFW